MKNKHLYLFPEPTIPARGLCVIKAMIEEHIAKRSPWTNSSGYTNKLKSFFLPDSVYDIVDEFFLERICESLICRVDNFIGNDVYNIYFTKMVAIDLRVEKCIDYRIYEWTQWKAGLLTNEHSRVDQF